LFGITSAPQPQPQKPAAPARKAAQKTEPAVKLLPQIRAEAD